MRALLESSDVGPAPATSRPRREGVDAGRGPPPPDDTPPWSARRRSAAAPPRSVAAAWSAVVRRGAAPSRTPSVSAARMGVAATEPSASADVAPDAAILAPGERHDDLGDGLRAPRADLAEADLAARRQRQPDAQQQLVWGERRPTVSGPEGGRRARVRSPRGPPHDQLGVHGQQDRAGCRRPVRHWRRCRRSCPGSGSGRRRWWRPPRPAPARGSVHSAERRMAVQVVVAPMTSASPSSSIPRRASSRPRSRMRSGTGPSSPVIWTIRSVPPAIGRQASEASSA